MMVVKNNFSYVFKSESVVIWNHNQNLKQYISFNCYSLQSRKKFYNFQKALRESEKHEYDCINDIYGLARQHNIRATHGHKPIFIGTIAL